MCGFCRGGVVVKEATSLHVAVDFVSAVTSWGEKLYVFPRETKEIHDSGKFC